MIKVISLDGPHTMDNDPYIDVEYYVDALDGRDWKIRATIDTETGSKWVTFAASPQGQEGTPYDEPGEVPPELKSLESALLAALPKGLFEDSNS